MYVKLAQFLQMTLHYHQVKGITMRFIAENNEKRIKTLFALYSAGSAAVFAVFWLSVSNFNTAPMSMTLAALGVALIFGWVWYGYHLFVEPLLKLLGTVEDFAIKGSLPYPPISLPSKEHQQSLLMLYSLAEKIRFRESTLCSATENLEYANQQLREHQDILLRNEKFASIGIASVDVANAVNNPIGFIADKLSDIDRYFEQFSNKQTADDPIDYVTLQQCHLMLRDAIRATQQIHQVIDDLKMFSSFEHVISENVDIHHDVIEPALRMTHQRYRHKAQLYRRYQFEDNALNCCVKELTHVIVNLMTNAGDAIDNYGSITIETTRTKNNLVIEISDTGCGLSEEEQLHMFQPFFTSKANDQRLGLGLTVCRELLDKMSASLSFDSQQGLGTKATITLPLNA